MANKDKGGAKNKEAAGETLEESARRRSRKGYVGFGRLRHHPLIARPGRRVADPRQVDAQRQQVYAVFHSNVTENAEGKPTDVRTHPR